MKRKLDQASIDVLTQHQRTYKLDLAAMKLAYRSLRDTGLLPAHEPIADIPQEIPHVETAVGEDVPEIVTAAAEPEEMLEEGQLAWSPPVLADGFQTEQTIYNYGVGWLLCGYETNSTLAITERGEYSSLIHTLTTEDVTRVENGCNRCDFCHKRLEKYIGCKCGCQSTKGQHALFCSLKCCNNWHDHWKDHLNPQNKML